MKGRGGKRKRRESEKFEPEPFPQKSLPSKPQRRGKEGLFDSKELDTGKLAEYQVKMLQQTCSSQGIELVYGTDKGRLYQWDLEQSKCIRTIQSHSCRIMDISFDAVRVVAGGSDGRVRMFDIITGHALQTLESGSGAVLALQVDSHFVFTAHRGGTLRRFAWASSADAGSAMQKHIFAPGDSIKKLSKKFGTPIQDLMQWNGLKDMRDAYIGMQLTVKRGYQIEEEDTSVLYGKLSFERKIRARYEKKREKRKMSAALRREAAAGALRAELGGVLAEEAAEKEAAAAAAAAGKKTQKTEGAGDDEGGGGSDYDSGTSSSEEESQENDNDYNNNPNDSSDDDDDSG
eukprot:CAMPEP_0206391558 /NCGR_PEP_ID=MMETSP0294-20121207/19358_1 /ASSEMBLY_ACC=CAM_ASM_000327 /TAXON_ID=39354 /ORGANISM="Heterosigma akashiwo, Strain CCMP2393" /LENGTH=345 /DNA_ID=CAMNT_0053844315 /DNA_START=1 /DNA_END=1038 /DNA_ORIENTATION=-